MRNVFIGFLFLVAIWIGWGAPVPGVVIRPMAPDDRLPTFERAGADRAESEHAAQGRQLPEDESQRPLRQRVVDAARRLEAFPCDKEARRELRNASVAFLKEQTRRVRNGENVDAAASLNREAGEIIEEAIFQGVLRPGDLPFGPSAARMLPVDETGRFVCENAAQR